jgi:hypothetical protein
MIPSDSDTTHPDASEFEPIPLKPKPPQPHTSPTSPMAPTHAPDTIAEPVPTGLRAAATYSATFLLSAGQHVNTADIEQGTKLFIQDKVKVNGTLKLTSITDITPNAVATTDPFTYEVQISTTNVKVKGKIVFVAVYLTALGKAGVTSAHLT